MATGWKGQSRPTLEGQVDLVTGKPLVQVTDLELPFGSTVFRLNRTRSSLVAHDAPAINRQKVSSPAIADAWWDWAGEGWMLSENPLLVIDAQWVDAGTSDMPPTSWLVLDAHRSIPFQNIQGSRRYEAPPRFRATMEVIEGKKLLVDRVTGKPTNDRSEVNSKLVWWSEPTRAKVTLYDGALTYWFAIIPKDYKPAIPVLQEGQQIADPQSATPGTAAGLIPPNRYFLSYLKNGVSPRAENLEPVDPLLQWVDGDYSDRPLNPDSMRALVSGDRSDPRYYYRAFYKTGGVWVPESTPTTDSGSPILMPGYGLPRLALLAKIEDRAGNEVHIEYVDTRTTVIDDPATPEVEYVQDGQSIGQIKAVHLVNRKTNRSGTTTATNEKELSWTLLYIHRSTAGLSKYAGVRNEGDPAGYVWNLIAGNGTPQNPGNRELLGMHGERVLDRVLAYKGGLSRNVLDQIKAADLTIGVEDKSGFFGRTSKVEDLFRKEFTGEQQASSPLAAWERQVRYQYQLNASSTELNGAAAVHFLREPVEDPSRTVEGTWSMDSITPQPVLAATRMTSRTIASGASVQSERVATRIFVNGSWTPIPSTAVGGVRDIFDPSQDMLGGHPAGFLDGGWRAFDLHSGRMYWLEGILEPDDVAAMLQDIDNAKRNENQTPGSGARPMTWAKISLKEATLQRWYKTGVRETDGLSDVTVRFDSLTVERMLRFASRRFSTNRFTGSDPNDPNTQWGLEHLPTMDQMTRTRTASDGSERTAYVQRPTNNTLSVEMPDGTVTETSIKINGKQRYYRIMRYLRLPTDPGPYPAFIANGGWFKAPINVAMPSAFVNPYTWFAYRERYISEVTGSEALLAPVASTSGGGTSPLANPRFIVVIDEFPSQHEMFARAEGTDDEPLGATTGATYRVLPGENGATNPNDDAVLPAQLSRRVVEINAWGNILRERRWDFKASGTAFVSQGVGEDFVYMTPVDLGLLNGVDLSDDPNNRTPWATKQFAQELFLVEKRSFGNSVATNGGTGAGEGLVEFNEYQRVDRSTGTPDAAALEKAPWGARVQLVASGIRRGTNGTKIYRSQRFFETDTSA